MSKYLALEWDEHEIRLAIASGRGSTAVLERAFAAPLPAVAEGQPHSAETVAGVLREALAGESLRRLETLAVVGRPSIELKELSLPPAPDEDMPDMVRFQALRDFTQLSEDTPLDFIPLPGEDQEHRSVLAAAISQELLGEIRSTCDQAGLELKHLVLRPCAAAALLKRHQPAAGQVRMFVDLLGDEVDLTVLDQDTPLLMRTTRLPGDASQPEYCRPVFLEIRRTIAAVQNKLHGRRVEKIWLCGDGPSQQTLAEMAKSELDLPTELFDPFTAFEQSAGMRQRLPDHHSRFAPLLGMLADAVAGERHAIDFLQPRRRPAPKTRQRELAIGIACAAVLLLGFIGWTWWRMESLDSDIALLQKQSAKLDKEIKKNTKVQKEAEALNKWLAGDIPWLDEIYKLATRGPKAEDAMLTAIKAEVDTKGGASRGKLTLDMLAKNASAVEKQLRSLYPETVRNGPVTKDDEKSKLYNWKFKTESKIVRESTATAKKGPAAKAGVKSGANTTKPGSEAEKSKAPDSDNKAVAPPAATGPIENRADRAKTETAPATAGNPSSKEAAPAANAAAPTTTTPISATPSATPAAQPAGEPPTTIEFTPATVAPAGAASEKNGG
jgi:Tfp pilus assembly PilM family ATPase